MKNLISRRSFLQACGATAAAAGLAACSSDPATSASTASTGTSTSASTDSAASGPLKLSYWVEMNTSLSSQVVTYADRPFWQEAMKRTNSEIEFVHPPVGQHTEQFNLLIASGDYTDLIQWDWTSYPGGPEGAIADDVIIPLNDLIEQYAPNYKKYLDENPEMDREAKTDEGTYYSFGRLMPDDINRTYVGPTIRKDWLDDLGLEVPTTLDEWHTVLTAFKEEKGATCPFTCYSWHLTEKGEAYPFIGAYDITSSFYQEDGVVKFGPAQPEFKEAMTVLNQWYEEELIDQELITNDSTTLFAKLSSGQAGAFIGYTSGGLGYITTLMQAEDPTVSWVAAPYPSLVKGETPKIGNKGPAFQQISLAITTACKDPVALVKFIDYFYSEEGSVLSNFGIEGTSFEFDDKGNPQLTDFITNDPDLDLQSKLLMYSQAIGAPPLIASPELRAQMNIYPEMTDAMLVQWCNSANENGMPIHITPLTSESSTLASILSDIQTYRDETMFAFIMGNTPLDQFDTFVANLEGMDLATAIEIKQNALNRYYER